MRNDDLANRVGVDEADVEYKGDEMMVKDDGLEIEVERDKGPSGEVGDEAVEGFDRVFAFFTSMLHYIVGAMSRHMLGMF